MIATDTAVKTVHSLVNGKWVDLNGPSHPVYNPATGQEIARLPYATAADVDRAVHSAHAAFRQWRETPVVDRVQPLYRFKALLEKHANELAAILTAENGKTIDDARAEVRRAIQMVEVACGMPSLMMGDSLERRVARHRLAHRSASRWASAPASRRSTFRPWCRCGCIPFAIACGNTFILKPSEKVPLDAHALRRTASSMRAFPPASLICCTAAKKRWTRCCIIRW